MPPAVTGCHGGGDAMLLVRSHSSESRWAISTAEPGVAAGSRGAAFLTEGRRKRSFLAAITGSAAARVGVPCRRRRKRANDQVGAGDTCLMSSLPPSARNEWHRLWGFNR